MVISPTVGRVVWFYPNGKQTADTQPLAATVAKVWNDRMVNLGFLDEHGNHGHQTSVVLVQEGEPEPANQFCCWMPYQVGQAKKNS